MFRADSILHTDDDRIADGEKRSARFIVERADVKVSQPIKAAELLHKTAQSLFGYESLNGGASPADRRQETVHVVTK